MGDVITNPDKFIKGWNSGLPETPCGHGSKLSTTVEQRKWIPEIIRKYEIKTIADIGAGDLNWISKMDLCGVDYKPLDLVPRHPDVQQFDLVNEVAPKVDMLMCLWVLNHLPYENSQRAILNLKNSGSRYLLMSDRPIWRDEQPPEIEMPFIECFVLNAKQDRLLLIDLSDCI